MQLVRRHLVYKLSLVLLVTISIGYGVPAYLNGRHQLRTMERMQAESAASVALGLAAGVRNAMLTGNAINAREMVKDARKSIGHVQLRIFAPNGEEVFAQHAPPAPSEIEAHVRAVLSTKASADTVAGARAVPIVNEPRCKFCHEKGSLRGVLTLGDDGAKVALDGGDNAQGVLTDLVTSVYIQLMTADHADRLGPYFTELGTQVPALAKVAVVDTDGDLALGDDTLVVPKAATMRAFETRLPQTVAPIKARKRGRNKKATSTTAGAMYVLPLINKRRCHACHDEEPAMRGAVVVEFAEGASVDRDALSATIRVGLRHVMLSGLGRLIRTFLEDVAETGAVTTLTLHDMDGRLYKDAFAEPQPPDHVASVLASSESFAVSQARGDAENFTYVEPLMNEARCQRCHGSELDIRGAIEVVLDTTEAANDRARLARMGVAFGFGTVFSVLVLLGLGLRLLVIRPVAEIGDVADRVAEGDLDTTVGVHTVDEIGRLGSRINQMVIELKKKLAMSKFVSDATVESIDAADGGEVTRGGERKHVTVLFSDVRGFTAFSETREPEEVVEMLNRYLHVQAEEVRKLGGDIDKFVGDELMAHFSGEHSERRAIEAGVRMIEAVTLANENLPPDYAKMAVGVGINSGVVVFGAMGAENRMDFTVIGDAVNLGARLCSAAAGGQVLVSGESHDAAGDMPDFAFEHLEPISVKGKVHPIRIHSVRRA